MADYIRTVPPEKFDMFDYRIDAESKKEHLCNSVGCVIGHCTALDNEIDLPRLSDGLIDFDTWSEFFTGLYIGNEEGFGMWYWCFASTWSKTDNTPEGAALRIEWLIKKGLPKNYAAQINGTAPLCYL